MVNSVLSQIVSVLNCLVITWQNTSKIAFNYNFFNFFLLVHVPANPHFTGFASTMSQLYIVILLRILVKPYFFLLLLNAVMIGSLPLAFYWVPTCTITISLFQNEKLKLFFQPLFKRKYTSVSMLFNQIKTHRYKYPILTANSKTRFRKINFHPIFF